MRYQELYGATGVTTNIDLERDTVYICDSMDGPLSLNLPPAPRDGDAIELVITYTKTGGAQGTSVNTNGGPELMMTTPLAGGFSNHMLLDLDDNLKMYPGQVFKIRYFAENSHWLGQLYGDNRYDPNI